MKDKLKKILRVAEDAIALVEASIRMQIALTLFQVADYLEEKGRRIANLPPLPDCNCSDGTCGDCC